MSRDGILLESGTNEVEILEFELDGQPFGVNVLKIQAIEQYDPERVTHIQLSSPSIIGTLLFREQCITLIDLGKEMDTVDISEITTSESETTEAVDVVDDADADPQPTDETDVTESVGTFNEYAEGKRLVLVMEFNNLKLAFLVDGVNRIHRASWASISPLSPILATTDSKFTGSLAIKGKEVLLVDMEKVVSELIPSGQDLGSISADSDHPNFRARGDLVVFLAEDSNVIREKVKLELSKGNYVNVQGFANGEECLARIDALRKQAETEGKQLSDYLDALISDIEMPAMDGLALCRTIKETYSIKDIPVIMFSSLINEQIARKCEDVGADAYITKPQFNELMLLLDQLCLAKQEA